MHGDKLHLFIQHQMLYAPAALTHQPVGLQSPADVCISGDNFGWDVWILVAKYGM